MKLAEFTGTLLCEWPLREEGCSFVEREQNCFYSRETRGGILLDVASSGRELLPDFGLVLKSFTAQQDVLRVALTSTLVRSRTLPHWHLTIFLDSNFTYFFRPEGIWRNCKSVIEGP